jgi:hypothetical protein
MGLTQGNYIIRDISEETFCAMCGWPLYIGDTVDYDFDENTFCCEGCRDNYRKFKAED